MKSKNVASHGNKLEYYAYSFLMGLMMLVAILMVVTLILSAGKSIMLSVVCGIAFVFIMILMRFVGKELKDIRMSEEHAAQFK